MVSKTVTVTDPEGLHMRPAGVFTKRCQSLILM